MKNLLLILIFSLFVISCRHQHKELGQQLANADSVAINYFKGDGSMDTVVAVKIVRDSNTVRQLATLISANDLGEIKKCGYDGSIHFFRNNVVIKDVDFRMNDVNCMHFSFKDEHATMTNTSLSEEAKQLIESIKK